MRIAISVVVATCIVALGVGWLKQSTAVPSVTVKLPPARQVVKPGFSFR